MVAQVHSPLVFLAICCFFSITAYGVTPATAPAPHHPPTASLAHTPTPAPAVHAPVRTPTPAPAPHAPVHSPTPAPAPHAPVHTPTPAPAPHAPVRTPTPAPAPHAPVHTPTPAPAAHAPVHTPTPAPAPHAPAHPPSPPSPNQPIPRSFVEVHGVVYCGSCKSDKAHHHTKATRISGATVKLQCNNTKQLLKVEGKTDQTGYFQIKAPKTVTSYGAHKCRVFLVSAPPSAPCGKPSKVNGGSTGAGLTLETVNRQSRTAIYTVGPFFFEPKCAHH